MAIIQEIDTFTIQAVNEEGRKEEARIRGGKKHSERTMKTISDCWHSRK
jgi:hypothetical protein